MSIRMRLTLLYSGILALTLIAFSLTLYVTQSRTILHDTRRGLAGRVDFLIDGPLRHRPIDKVLRSDPTKFGTIAQISDLDGRVLERSPTLGESLALPLSEAALQAAQQGESSVEIGTVDSERLLIHNQVFTAEDGDRLILQMATSLADEDQNLASLGRILLMGSSVAVIAAFGIGWLLAGFTLRPINRLRLTAQAIGAERDFNRRVDYAGPNDEIGQLVTTFNNMLAELQAAYIHVEETLQTQRRFVADASHELRTPLTTLRGNIGLLQRKPPIVLEDRTDVLADMVDETERLMRLVNELLELARADAGRPLHLEPVHLKPLLEDVAQQIKLLAPERTVDYHSDHDLTVIGDGDALKQVLLILLDNALTHTSRETAINLSVTQNHDKVAIRVSDNGPGISPSHLPHIFDRFYRGDTARTSPGTGLGLAIANELTQAQHGTLTVESEVGQGSTFTLTFPQSPPLDSADEMPTHDGSQA